MVRKVAKFFCNFKFSKFKVLRKYREKQDVFL